MSQLFANNAGASLGADITTTATSMTVAVGKGALYPNPSTPDYFLATLYTADSSGNVTASEIVQVTARSTDTFTIVRAQEGTTAQAWLAATCKVALMLTAGAITGTTRIQDTRPKVNGVNLYQIPNATLTGGGTMNIQGNYAYYFPFLLDHTETLDQLMAQVTTAGTTGGTMRLGIVRASDSDWTMGTLVLDAGTIAIDTTGVKTISVSQVLGPGRYFGVVNPSVNVSLEVWPLNSPINGIPAAGGSTLIQNAYAARTAAAFADPMPAIAGTNTYMSGWAALFLLRASSCVAG